MTRTVKDAAVLLTALAGGDAADPATQGADAHRADYAKGLDADALQGAHLGVMRFQTGYSPRTDAVFEAALDILRKRGATLVDIKSFDMRDMERLELTVLLTELKAGLNAYLATTPPAVKTRTLADVIAFNLGEPREMEWFGQDLFESAERTGGLEESAYLQARDTAKRLATQGIDSMLTQNDVVALIAPTTGPAWMIDLVNGDHFQGSASALPAIAGYPHLTVPAGESAGLPVGLSFIGPAWSEQALLAMGYAFEQARARSEPSARH
jgi:amidase